MDEMLPAQPGGCARCHVGLGMKPNAVDEVNQDDYDNVDCLICHSPVDVYKRTVVKEGEKFVLGPTDDTDILAAAQSAQSPDNDMCLRCHASTGGGPNFKHGVIPTMSTDVHMAGGLTCINCHTTEDHKMAGGADLKIVELPDVIVTCTNCHPGTIHSGEYALIEMHTDRIRCQTCHIPEIARDPTMPTQTFKDWTTDTPKLKPDGTYAPAAKFANNLVPVYKWWNGQVQSPPAPLGSIDDPNAKISPWKYMQVIAPVDAESKKPLYIKAGAYFKTGSLDTAINLGVQATGQEYSGSWEGHTEDILFSNNHQIAPAEQALHCDSCHRQNGRLDFEALGYSEERAEALQFIYMNFAPLAVNGSD